MRTVAAIPAAGLVAGAAAGLLFPDLSRVFLLSLLIGFAAGAVAAWRLASSPVFAAAVAGVFLAGGALLAADGWQRAWRPPLRVVFEALARNQRALAAREGRRLPEDDEAFAILTGTLRSDAAPTESGASLSVEVDGLEGQEAQEGQKGQAG